MRVVVTGASGFLGAAVVRRLREAGGECLGVARAAAPGLCRVASYADAPAGDVLIHLAEASDRAAANRMGSGYEQSAAATLKALLEKGYSRVIYASSAVLYDDGACTPRTENDNVRANDTYSRVKLASEQIVLGRTGSSIARIANLYGPGMAGGNVLSDILRQLGEDGPMSLQDTSPVRDFLWIEDAAEALRMMATASVLGVFNVGSGTGTSILDLAKAALEAAGQAGRRVVSMRQATAPSCIVLDTSRATKCMDWRPSVPLKEGLRRVVEAQGQSEHK